MPQIKNRTGIRYGRLIATKLIYQDYSGSAYWLCKCDCGNGTIVSGCHLQTGHTQSCKCLNREVSSNMCNKRTEKNNPNYKNGASCGIHIKEILDLKESIRKRDGYKCQECGITQEENKKKLDVHHIDGNDTNNAPKNMISLCVKCHRIKKMSGPKTHRTCGECKNSKPYNSGEFSLLCKKLGIVVKTLCQN